MLSILGVIILAVVLINFSPVQNFLVHRATRILSDKLNTRVTVKHVNIGFLNRLLLQGVYVEDHAHDTLAYVGELQLRITDWFLVKRDIPVLHYLGLKDAYIHLYRTRTSGDWNYLFIEDAFSAPPSNKKKTTTSQSDFKIDFQAIDLEQVRFHMDDAWVGYDYDIDIGRLDVNAQNFDMSKRIARLKNITLENGVIILKDYKGGRPPRPRPVPVIDTTPFNPDNWILSVRNLDLVNCRFKLVAKEEAPYPNEFDPEYIDVSGIDLEAEQINIHGDTLTGKMAHLAAKERSGIVIKEMRSQVSVSPVATICDNLYLETNNSKLRDYYAMHYTRFPDFEEYIDKVRMAGRFKSSYVSFSDIAYFAPLLRKYPSVLRFSGTANGTVADLSAQNLQVTDGYSTIKGNFSIKGLPDIDNAPISWQNGELFTTGEFLSKYIPAMKDNPNLAFEKLQFIYFKGSFGGTIYDFGTKGNIRTSLGDLTTDIRIKMPSKGRPVYSGHIVTNGFHIGSLTRQPYVGIIAMDAELKGASFDVEGLQIAARTDIFSVDINNYTYRNISADGTWQKKQFTGKMLVNDSNLALGFYGNLDWSKKDVHINATANLLKCDLQKIKLSQEPASLTADFDLNCSGQTIDDFTGKALLYNINLWRKSYRVDLDSINISAYSDENGRNINIESNLLSAAIKGNYKLSSMPPSTQYFLSRYLPHYIKPPLRYPADQDISFDIHTRDVDSMLTAFVPMLSGFNNAAIKGNLNTTRQQLKLSMEVPYGSVGGMKFYNTSITGEGNLEKLVLKGDVASFKVGDLLNTSISLNASVGEDSVFYKIATKSDNSYGTATLNGKAYASGDTLYMSMLPSELFLNDIKWEIPAGNRIVLSGAYLYVSDLYLRSGLQELSFRSENETTTQSLSINASNIDLAQLGSLASLSYYRPDGRLSGYVRIDHLFGKPQVIARLNGQGVKLGRDTFGTVSLHGAYDVESGSVALDKGTGIFNDRYKINADGTIALKETGNAGDAHISLEKVPLNIVAPFLEGYVSKIKGTVNGDIDLTGSINNPNTSGSLKLSNVEARVDYIGCLYSIPDGTINLKGQRATIDDITLYDVNKNSAALSGYVSYPDFSNVFFNVQVRTPQLQVVNLRDFENPLFYGNVVANAQLTVTGPINNINMSIRATPTQSSQLYIPYNSSGDVGTNTYITFKSYGTAQTNTQRKKKDKLSVNIAAVLNPLINITMVIDPATGDQISAVGSGNMNINVPADDDYSMFGTYYIDHGSYTFTFRQIIVRKFLINSGSSIVFNGPLAQTKLDIHTTYQVRARLYDLLNTNDINQLRDNREIEDAKTQQPVNVLLRMTGSLSEPVLKYEIELPEKRSIGTYAYTKLSRINQSEQSELFNQVVSLLLIGSFIPPEGISSSMVMSGAINNVGEVISSTASSQLTNVANRLLRDKNLSIQLQYKTYSVSDAATLSPVNRNELKFGLKRNYFNDRLVLQLGSAYDWGRPTGNNTNSNNFNLAGDFRAQYLLTPDGRITLTGFRTSNYDVLVNDNISRTGVGITFRKSFDNFFEFIHGQKRNQEKKEKADTTSAGDQ